MKAKGYYDLLLSLTDEIDDNYLTKNIKQEAKNIADIDQYLLNQTNNLLLKHLANISNLDEKMQFLNNLLATFSNQQLSDNVLLQIKAEKTDVNYQSNIRLVDNYLFTNSNEQNLIEQLNKEIITSDTVAFVYPFISKTMINKLRNAFNYALEHNIAITFITTTFDNQALFVNLYELEQLIERYPNITIRIEDNTELRSERIHIKAAIFQRASGFSSVIIGSSNLTIPGMVTGREWNLRISEFENPDLYHKIYQEYHNLWNDNLIDFNDETARKALFRKIVSQEGDNHIQLVNYVLYDFQIDILEKLAYRRRINKNKHLIIMATGTGKTVVSAFDYLRQTQSANKRPRILFLAHQKEIIEQALTTFRQVLNDENFASILSVTKRNFSSGYLFATIQKVHLHLNKFDRHQFDVIIFDEAHHIAAKTFDKVFNYFQPKEVIGLTATPEREDNKSILPYFDHEFAYELRLWDAINQRLLSKFDYYCIDDITSDLVGIDLNSDSQVFKALNNDSRNQLLFDVIKNYIGIYHQPLVLVFCINIEHAAIISNFLNKQGLKAAYLTSKTNHLRSKIISDFRKRKINYLCVVNIFNEGIDVPEIDTIILLRPTNSKTVFLQQLGRGLRKTKNKNKLSVYDLIANIDQRYDITIGIKNLYHNQATLNQSEIFKQGFSLPDGCTITLETKSKEVILNNLQAWYQVPKRMYQVVRNYYQKFQEQGLAAIIADYDLSLPLFYHYLNNFYFAVGSNGKINQNQTFRKVNILKQFLFLNNYHIINYFYLRLKADSNLVLNYHYDNLLIASLFPEATSRKVFSQLFPNDDNVIADFIKSHDLVVQELLMILNYKLQHEILLTNESQIADYPLLIKNSTYTVRQALVAIKRLNFLKEMGILQIIAFQAGYLTYEKSKSVVFADLDANNYGKLTKYQQENETFYWSIPENKGINSKLVSDLQNNDITKFLFLDNKINKNYPNLSLKLYDFIGIGSYLATLNEQYLTIKFKIIEKAKKN